MTGAEVGRRRRIWGWMLFDVAQQPYATLGLTFVFGPYFAAVAAGTFMAGGLDAEAAGARAQSLWGWAQAGAGLLVALTAPFVGALADASGHKTRWIALLSIPYVLCALGLWGLGPDGAFLLPALALFWAGFVAGETALNVNNAMLPEIARAPEVGRVSGTGSALGYWGGVGALLVMLLLLAENDRGVTLLGLPPLFGLDPAAREGTRSVGPVIALWYVLFIIPFFLWVHDPPRPPGRPRATLGGAWSSLRRALADARRRPSLLGFLLGSMLYRDALGGLYSFGGIYAALVLGWSVIEIGVFGIIAAVAAALVSWAGGLADQRLGPKPVIVASAWALVAVCTVAVGLTRSSFLGLPLAPGSAIPDIVFYVCGAAIGGAGGALYSASRTLMVRHADPGRAGEAFGLFALSGRATAFLAPALVALATALTGSVRAGLVPLIVLFLAGLWLLRSARPDGDRLTPAGAAP